MSIYARTDAVHAVYWIIIDTAGNRDLLTAATDRGIHSAGAVKDRMYIYV